MIPTTLTPDAICALDGPRLTVLAAELGLAPGGYRPGDPWRPDVHVAQAYALLPRLRGLGWYTQVWGSPAGPGEVVVWRDDGSSYAQAFGGEGEPTEAMALVLCAVLAVAESVTPEETA